MGPTGATGPAGPGTGDVLLTAAQTLTNKTLTNPALTNQTLTDGATIAWNMANGSYANVMLGGNRTVAAPTNQKKGPAWLFVSQDGTGGRTLSWNAAYRWQGGVAPVLSTAPNATDVLMFVSDGTLMYGQMLIKGAAVTGSPAPTPTP